jgi:hypothetical protein
VNRWALAIILAYVAAFGLPKASSPVVPAPSIPTPSTTMRDAVQPVTAAMANASQADRNLFADVWVKVGRVVSQEDSASPLIVDTRTLREFVRIAATIGWNRLGNKRPGEVPNLDAACDKAFSSVLGMEAKPLDAGMRGRFDELCEALAWAALQR